MTYNISVTYTYTTVANATTAQTQINTALANAGRAETCGRTGATLSLLLEGLTEGQAVGIRDALTSRWAVGTRNGGRACVELVGA